MLAKEGNEQDLLTSSFARLPVLLWCRLCECFLCAATVTCECAPAGVNVRSEASHAVTAQQLDSPGVVRHQQARVHDQAHCIVHCLVLRECLACRNAQV